MLYKGQVLRSEMIKPMVVSISDLGKKIGGVTRLLGIPQVKYGGNAM